MEMTQSLHRALQQEPDRASTVFGDRQRTVAETADRVARLAGALVELGVAPGDRVGLLALNSDRYLEYLLAVPWSGAAVNPVNIRWSPAEIAYSLVDCGTRVLLVDDAFAAVIPALRAQAPVLQTVIFCGEGPTPDGALNYEELVAGSDAIEDRRRGGDDLYGVFYTGGTTGHPKGVMLSHRNLLSSAMSALATADVVTRRGRLLHAAPLFHLAGIAIWTIGSLADTTHVVVPMFTPAGVIEAVEAHRVTDVLLVPTMIQMLIDSPQAHTADLSSVRHVVYGASPITEDVLGRARAALPAAGFTQAYGMTELSPIATVLQPDDHDDPALIRSAGRPGVGVDVRIVDPGEVELARGQIGEIVVRGDNVMQGYWNKPTETAAALRDGYMHTGDLGYMNDQGYVFVVDRLKDMIITGGENVYSAEVENALSKHPAVAACAVIGVEDAQWGERVHAVVVLQPASDATVEDLQAFCRDLIANYKLPRSVAFVDELPMSGAGKILKRELRQQHRSHP
jgi:acyl-CoA synthetase (AMP-forming)/AMP-acid ligase II